MNKFMAVWRREWVIALLFLAPSVIGFAVFYVIPFAIGGLYSLMDSTVDGSYVGLENYEALLDSRSFRKAATNSFLFTSVSVPLVIMLSMSLAMAINRRLFLRNWLQTTLVLPLVVPVASVVLFWQLLFDWNGSMNLWLNSIGIERIDWMKSEWSIGVVTMMYIWKNLGYNMILFLAGLQSIPKDYYETAELEGAGRWAKFTHITLIYLTPTMFLVILMSIIHSFRIFRETYLIAGNYPYDRIYMLQHYMNNMFASLDMQKLTAAAALMVGCILILVSVMLLAERRFRNFME